MLFRPLPYLAAGAFGALRLGRSEWEPTVNLGLRPFGNAWLTLFGDYSLAAGRKLPRGNSLSALSRSRSKRCGFRCASYPGRPACPPACGSDSAA